MASAARNPDVEFTHGGLRTHGADGPGGVGALAGGFREVATRLQQQQPGTPPSLPSVKGNDLAAVNELIVVNRSLLDSLGGDPTQHLTRL